ncbi:hypothetical protein Bbelb_349390 [Branchiostoma belcheri]|nr:hypothetical protein Bbelb_349390 [Branchiostoma belcheri]
MDPDEGYGSDTELDDHGEKAAMQTAVLTSCMRTVKSERLAEFAKRERARYCIHSRCIQEIIEAFNLHTDAEETSSDDESSSDDEGETTPSRSPQVLQTNPRIVAVYVEGTGYGLVKHEGPKSEFPKETFSDQTSEEANLVSSIQVTERLQSSKVGTFHSDGASEQGQKLIGMQANTSQGVTSSLGLATAVSGAAEEQLDAVKFVFSKMAALTSSAEDRNTKYNELIVKLKNTMGDRAATQNNTLFESYRKELLPEVEKNWDSLTQEEKQNLATMNHLTKMASMRDRMRTLLIRTDCDAFAPGGNQQARRIQDFKDFLRGVAEESGADDTQKKKNEAKIKAFRANRFNILFECAAGVYYHRYYI